MKEGNKTVNCRSFELQTQLGDLDLRSSGLEKQGSTGNCLLTDRNHAAVQRTMIQLLKYTFDC